MKETRPDFCGLLRLPSELLDTILSYLSPLELAAASLVCQTLNQHANEEIHWQHHVLENLPGNKISSPYPCQSWRELYKAHDPHWFLTKYKVWFCDRDLTGHIIVARYDKRRGCIEGYRLLGIRSREGSEAWATNSDVQIHAFEVTVKLHLDKPVLQLNPRHGEGLSDQDEVEGGTPPRTFCPEQPMSKLNTSDPRLSNFLLAKVVDDDIVFDLMNGPFPYGYMWPPPSIPADHRVRGQHVIAQRRSEPWSVVDEFSGVLDRRADASDKTFRIRHWMELGSSGFGVRMGEEISTYSTLDPHLWTPTAEKPWRGIWVGDYSGHGCEFLLINQPEVAGEEFEEPLVRGDGESQAEFEQRFLHERVYRGRLEAIKLTGDPNVPRGEYTFVSEDLGPNGFVTIAQDSPFQGTRVVKSKGHIAATGFMNSELGLIHVHSCHPGILCSLTYPLKYRQIYRVSALPAVARPPRTILGRIWTH